MFGVEINRDLPWEHTVSVAPKGISFTRKTTYNPGFNALTRSRIAPRGRITSFSRHSSLRLRRALLQSDLPHDVGCKVFGVTLTLPWQSSEGRFLSPMTWDLLDGYLLDEDLVGKAYRQVFNRFGVAFKRSFPHSAAIFRHELQVRDMPHCHLVFYLSNLDKPLLIDDEPARLCVWVKQKMLELWQRALLFDFGKGNIEYFIRHGVDVRGLVDQIAMFRYIADHTSKHKFEQMGYRGKQWGYLNRVVFVDSFVHRFDFASSDEMIFFVRHVRRLCRYTVDHSRTKGADGKFRPLKCVFGCKKSSSVNGLSVVFLSCRTSLYLLRWIKKRRVLSRLDL